MAAQAKSKKAPLTAKDFPDAPIGQPTDPRCVCFLVGSANYIMTNPGSTTTAAARAIRVLEKTVGIAIETRQPKSSQNPQRSLFHLTGLCGRLIEP
jgi:hypothetical protein